MTAFRICSAVCAARSGSNDPLRVPNCPLDRLGQFVAGGVPVGHRPLGADDVSSESIGPFPLPVVAGSDSVESLPGAPRLSSDRSCRFAADPRGSMCPLPRSVAGSDSVESLPGRPGGSPDRCSLFALAEVWNGSRPRNWDDGSSDPFHRFPAPGRSVDSFIALITPSLASAAAMCQCSLPRLFGRLTGPCATIL